MTRRRSENVGWGPVCRAINRERAEGGGSDREFTPRRKDETRHPNSAKFESEGRVPRVGEEEEG
ncbi:MAG TPA: hypothetical protein VFV36_05360 [Candidatus Methylomirabilis sp.]|nr:hypothetical protein [Candidatus Methylomirabilis sp.]